MTEMSITKKVSGYNFNKCHLPRLYDGTIINKELHVIVNDKSHTIVKYEINNCLDLVNPIKINNDTNEGYDCITASVIRNTIILYSRNNEIYNEIYNEIDSKFTPKLLQHENTDSSLINIVANSLKLRNEINNLSLCGAVVVRSNVWIISQYNECKNRYLYISSSKYKFVNKEIVLIGNLQTKGQINIYRKSRSMGLSRYESKSINIKSIDIDKNSNRLYTLLATNRKGFASYLDYFPSLETFSSSLNIIKCCKNTILKYSPRGIVAIEKNNIIVLCNAWAHSEENNISGFIYYYFSH
jgi:hypothetical protein